MSGKAPSWREVPPCPRCAGLCGIHYLTCPTLRLPADWLLTVPEEE